MKNPIVQFSIVVLAFVALAFVMGYTKPLAGEPTQYILVEKARTDSFQKEVNQKISEGWHLQGGVVWGEGGYIQAMVK